VFPPENNRQAQTDSLNRHNRD